MSNPQAISASTEDYLEAILRLIAEKGAARVRDIADLLAVHRSTVSWTLKSLAEKKLVHYSRYEIATLTPLGERIAQDVQRRHDIVARFLTEILGVGDEAAQANACRMEHVVNPEVIERFSLMVDYARQHPVPVGDWLRQFHQYACPRVRTRIKRAERLSQSAAKIPFTLDQLKPGQKAAIVKITAAGTLGRRLAEMGMVRGAPVEVVKVAPLGGPIEVRVKGYSLSLRKNEAAAIAIDLS